LITIIYDKIEPSREFIPLLRRFETSEINIVIAPTFDYKSPIGIRYMPAFISLIKRLSRRKFRTSYRFSEILQSLNLLDNRHSDFEMAISIMATLWLINNLNLIDYFGRITDVLNVKPKIYPLTDPPLTILIETDSGRVPLYKIYEGEIEFSRIKQISFNSVDKAKVPPKVKKVFEESSKIILYQPSIITVKLLNELEDFQKILQSHSGTIIYLLPDKINPIDIAILAKEGLSQDWIGLIEMIHKGIDVIVFDENKTGILEAATKYQIAFFPIPYDVETKEGVNKFVNSFLKILNINSSRK